MRPGPCPALLLPLLILLAPLAAAQEQPPVRVLHPRTVFWTPGEEPVELHVAAGTPTRVQLESFEHLGLERMETPSVQVLPASETAFILTPGQDFAPGERTRVTVKLSTAPDLELPLLLISGQGEVDSQVRLVQLRAPTPEELAMESMAQVLNTVPLGQVSLAVAGPVFQGPQVKVRVESVLRMDTRVFVTLAVWHRWPQRGSEPLLVERVRLRAVLAGGTRVELPLLRIPGDSKHSWQRHTLIAPLPERSAQLSLAVEGEGAPEGFHMLPPGQEPSSP